MRNLTGLGFGIAAVAAVLFGGGAEAAQSASGIFTAQQAATGKQLYDRHCGNCHGAAMVAGAASALVGNAFVAKWGGKATAVGKTSWSGFKIDALLSVMIDTMPPKPSDPVSPAEQLSILTYILQRNGFAAGETTLTANAAALRDTTLVFAPTVGDVGHEERYLVWVDRDGRETRLPAPTREYYLPRLSPDGKQVAIEVHSDKTDIWIVDVATGALRQLTHEGTNRFPLWSPDSKRVLYASDRYRKPVDGKRVLHGEGHDVYWQAADGSGEAERLTFGTPPLHQLPHAPQKFSPDGKTLSIYEIDPVNKRDIWMMPVGGDRKPWPFLVTPHAEAGVGFSKDGKWLAYTSDETGRYELMIRRYPDASGQQAITTEGGLELLWPLGSKEVFYRNGKKRMAIDVIATNDGVKVGTPRVLFEGDFLNSPGTRAGWDSIDGQRFLMVKTVPGSAAKRRAED